jgi:hypothetical protein
MLGQDFGHQTVIMRLLPGHETSLIVQGKFISVVGPMTTDSRSDVLKTKTRGTGGILHFRNCSRV